MAATPVAELPEGLLEALLHGARPAVFFLGAGASIESGIPGARDLLRRLRSQLPASVGRRVAAREAATGSPAALEDVAQAFQDEDGNLRRFTQLLPREEWLAKEPNCGHRALAELWAESLVADPFTTNVDDLIERGFVPVLGKKGSACFDPEHFCRPRPMVYKVHGCLEREHYTVWARSDLQRQTWAEEWKAHALGAALQGAAAVVFVGFRTRLPYLVSTLDGVPLGPNRYMVNKTPFAEFEADADGRKFLETFGINEARYIAQPAPGDCLRRRYAVQVAWIR